MTKNKNKPYLPKERTGYYPEKHALISHGKIEGPPSTLANTVEDPIVVNNIATSEFDYTEEFYSSDDF